MRQSDMDECVLAHEKSRTDGATRAEVDSGEAAERFNTKRHQQFRTSLKSVLANRGIWVSPVGFIFGFAGGIYIPVFTELIKDRVCEVILGYPSDLCETIGKSTDKYAADEVQALSAHYMMYNSLVTSVPCLIFALFLGSWSDRFGRKTLMAVNFVGTILSSGILLACAYLKLHPGYLLAVPALCGVFGGWKIFLVSCFSYIGDYTNKSSRSLIIALFSGIFGLGMSTGQYTGSALLKGFGYLIPFFVYLGLQCAALLYVMFVIKDHPDFHQTSAGQHKALKICEIQSLTDNWTMISRRREDNGRRHLVTLLVGYMASMCTDAELSILQLFLEFKPLSWDVQQYGMLAVVQGILNIGVLTLLVPLKKVFELSDTTIGIFGSLSAVTMACVYAVSYQTWMVYLGMSVGLLRQFISVCLQSSLLGLVDREENGKILSMVAIIQGVGLILGATSFVKIFSATAKFWPGLVFAVQGFVLLVPLLSFGYVDVARRKSCTTRQPEI